jgi:predicted ATPase/DNA-binding winged helix-turn-helix (wHTH) protein
MHDITLLLLENAMEVEHKNGEGFAFRRFRIYPRERLLLLGEVRVELGSRAFDLLLALIEAAGTIVTRDELVGRVWPNRTVIENNLHVQVAALRNILGPDRDAIRTVAGRGYLFTAELHLLSPAGSPASGSSDANTASSSLQTNLPEPVSDLIGRDAELLEILDLVQSHRLVTLTGPGGIGKTRLAIEAARRLLPQFSGGVWLVDLSMVVDPALAPAAIAATVGLDSTASASAESIAAALAARELLIVLDTCEHVIDAATETAEALLRAGRGIRVVVTSRETLKASGEWVYRVPPLPVSAAGEPTLLPQPAMSLFIARARATDMGFSPENGSAAAIAKICRCLDGIPLAIELAAARAATLGIHTLADHLDDHLQLLTCGRRTALPRQQTLRATFDWSYALLTEVEQVVLCSLAVHRGAFDLDAVKAIAGDAAVAPAEATEALANLVAKSLVSNEIVDGTTRHRLLETTRAYALEKLAAGAEDEATVRRRAEHCPVPPPFETAPRGSQAAVGAPSWRFAT